MLKQSWNIVCKLFVEDSIDWFMMLFSLAFLKKCYVAREK